LLGAKKAKTTSKKNNIYCEKRKRMGRNKEVMNNYE